MATPQRLLTTEQTFEAWYHVQYRFRKMVIKLVNNQKASRGISTVNTEVDPARVGSLAELKSEYPAMYDCFEDLLILKHDHIAKSKRRDDASSADTAKRHKHDTDILPWQRVAFTQDESQSFLIPQDRSDDHAPDTQERSDDDSMWNAISALNDDAAPSAASSSACEYSQTIADP